MANETYGAVRLRNKISDVDIADSELLEREIAFDNTDKIAYIKDYAGLVHKLMPILDNATSALSSWSSDKISAELLALDKTPTVYDDITSEVDQLAIDPAPNKGDIVIRQDIAETYIRKQVINDDITDWSLLKTSTVHTHDEYIDDAGLLDLFDSQFSSTAGYQKLPNGFIFQWGNIVAEVVTSGSITFPIAFPTACLFRIAKNTDENGSSPAGSSTEINVYDDLDPTHFHWAASNVATATLVIPGHFSWFALGY